MQGYTTKSYVKATGELLQSSENKVLNSYIAQTDVACIQNTNSLTTYQHTN